MENPINIICVDDEQYLLRSIRRTLLQSNLFNKVITTNNGPSAIDLLKEDKYHIALVDLHMPGMNGLELIGRIRVVSPNTKTIVLTGNNDPNTVVSAMKAGANDYLTKPFEEEQLIKAVEELIEKYSLDTDSQEPTMVWKRPLRLLLVDNSQQDRTTIKKLFINENPDTFEIEDTVNIHDAIAAYETFHPDCIIAEFDLPDGTAIDLLNILKDDLDEPPVPVIILTENRTAEVAIQAMKTGATDYLFKNGVHAPGFLYKTAQDTIINATKSKKKERKQEQKDQVITELVEMRDTLQHHAFYDALTKIPNRRAILDELEKELSRTKRDMSLLSVCMCDIDHFKKVNDTYGHLVGDELLKSFVDRVKHSIRESDHVGRYGGEEFLLVLPHMNETTRMPELFERLRLSICKRPFMCNDVEMYISASFGVAICNGRMGIREIIKQADQALYKAKRTGRNRIIYS